MTCTICNGMTYLPHPQRQDEPGPSCQCYIRATARKAIDRHPPLRGVKARYGLCVTIDGQTRAKTGNMLVQARWDTFAQHLAGWIAVQAGDLFPPRIWLATENNIRDRHFSDRFGKERQELADYDLIVVRMTPTKHEGTSQAIFDLVLEASVLTTSLWLVVDRPLDLTHPKAMNPDNLDLVQGYTVEVLS